jgi:hypothetical protein
VLVGLGPGVGVEEGMGVMVGNVGLGEDRVVCVAVGVGISVGAGMELGVWQPASTIRMMVNIACPIRRYLRRSLCKNCIMMKYSIIV